MSWNFRWESLDRPPAMMSLPRFERLDDRVTMRIVCLDPCNPRIVAPKAASRNILEKLRVIRTDDAADIRLDAM
jgi:hypothetical protein